MLIINACIVWVQMSCSQIDQTSSELGTAAKIMLKLIVQSHRKWSKMLHFAQKAFCIY